MPLEFEAGSDEQARAFVAMLISGRRSVGDEVVAREPNAVIIPEALTVSERYWTAVPPADEPI